jgi:hypothetical protein
MEWVGVDMVKPYTISNNLPIKSGALPEQRLKENSYEK